MGVYKAGNDFAVGSLEVTSDILNKSGNAVTAAGLVVTPFLPPVGAALYTVGNGLSAGSAATSIAAKAVGGNLTSGDVLKEAAFVGVGYLGGNALKSLKIGGGGDEVLQGVFENSLNITKDLVVPAFQQTISNNKKKKKD